MSRWQHWQLAPSLRWGADQAARADPDLPMLFSGEEILYTARLWTSGYDLFAPTANVVFHQYSGSSSTRPKFWEVRTPLEALSGLASLSVCEDVCVC